MNDLKKQLNISNHAQQTARMLIDQQMWCWGCDVRWTHGNFLLLYGAQKRPSPNPRFHSAYSFRIGEEIVLNLWGWGLWIASPHRGSLFVARSRFHVCYMRDTTLMPDAWCRRDLPLKKLEPADDDLANARNLLGAALHWTGTYEAWLNEQVPHDYRERVLAQWPRRRQNRGGIPAAEMAENWFGLSKHVLTTH